MSIPLESNGYFVLDSLHMQSSKTEDVLRGWSDSFINMPEVVPFWEPDVLEELYDYLDFDEDRRCTLNELLTCIKNTAPLKAYVWHLYYRLVTLSYQFGCSPSHFWDFPVPQYHLGEKADYAMLAAALGAAIKAREKFREMHIPENIIRDTLVAAFGNTIKDPRHKRGRGGMGPASFGWLRLYVAGRLVQLGRFQFKIVETNLFGVVLQHRLDRRKILLMEPGIKLNSHGLCYREKDLWNGPWNDPYGEKVFTSEIEYLPDGWRGYPVDPRGYCLTEKQFFPKKDWELILKAGDPMIDMHIPGGGGMTPELCKESFRLAFSFFEERYPERFKPVIISHSWIFNSQLEDYLPDSNLAKLQRECYLFPFPSNGQDGFFFVFGQYYRPEEMASAPQDTSLRRTLLKIAQTPEQLHCAGMLFFKEDLDDFGTQHYRNGFRQHFVNSELGREG